MKKILSILFLILMILSCNKKNAPVPEAQTDTPAIVFDRTPLPDFSAVAPSQMLQTAEVLMEQHNREIEQIAENAARPTFENTVEAIEFSGEKLDQFVRIFNCLYFAETTDELDSIAEILLPKIKEHEHALFANKKLFARICALRDNAADSLADEEERRLLEVYHKNFVRNGASLDDEWKMELSGIEKQISFLEVQFSKNLLSETNDYKLVVDNAADLGEMPQNIVALAAEDAHNAGMDGKWIFTLQKSSFIPFMQHSPNRELRRKIYLAYNNRGASKNAAITNSILNLRVRKAHLLGYENYAAFVLENNMAQKPENVYALMDEIWRFARKKARAEAEELQKIMNAEECGQTLQAWDWWYYSEKLRQAKYRLDAAEIQNYFPLDGVRDGAFLLAKKLFGITMTKRTDVQTYHPDVQVYNVTDKNGAHLGVLYTDYFPRPGKRSGAWMDELSQQYVRNGENHRPAVINVANFTRPADGKPALLTADEVCTLFHEFGHALNCLLSQCRYPSLSGTSTPPDFVEMPSQLMENWAMEPEMLRLYARHHQTNAVMPDSLIAQIQKSKRFNTGFEHVELLAAAYTDLNLHSAEAETPLRDNAETENRYMSDISLPAEIAPRYRIPNFAHIFSFGYEACYYSYVWSRMLDADIFEYFKKSGNIFNPEIAESYRKNILERGNVVEPMEAFTRFRGRTPDCNILINQIIRK